MSVLSVYANVVVDLTAATVKDKLFTYRVPESLTEQVMTGASVLVPFGHKQAIAGYVISCSSSIPEIFVDKSVQLKEIMAVLDTELFFNEEYIEFLKWVANYYAIGLIDVLTAAIPRCLAGRSKQKIRLMKNLSAVQTVQTDHGNSDEATILDLLSQTKKREISLSGLKQRWTKLSQQKEAQFYRALNNLFSKGLVERFSANSIVRKSKQTGSSGWRDPLQYLHDQPLPPHTNLELTDDQNKVFAVLKEALLDRLNSSVLPNETKEISPWLLHGVTGSGKTEIYLRLVEETLKLDRNVLLMVPEIALTPQLAQRLVEKFGKLVAVWHSGLSDGEHYDTWQRLRSGELKIVLGARSAILINIPKLGLIIIDEEHDASYKQSNSPRYNAKTLALEKAKRQRALVVYGSATPDIATYFQADKEKQILSLPKRIFNQEFPQTILVDMRAEFAAGSRSVFSQALLKALSNCLQRREQIILLMNRRGYANQVFCQACGHLSSCKNCSVALVYHRQGTAIAEKGRLICHHCGYQFPAVEICPACHGPFLKHYGIGTQKVEAELKQLFPETKILRMDSDTTQRKGSYQQIFEQFSNRQADVLIGTQMVAKGLDNRNVTLVGILAADAAFNLPDYRSSERGFQLLTQVSGRAGRGNLPGKVIVQTYNPQMPALKISLSNDYLSFYRDELNIRQTFLYPPFSQIIRVVIVGDLLESTQLAAENIVEAMSNYLADLVSSSAINILGPAPCLLEKLHGKYRQHLIIKNQIGNKGRELILAFFKNKNFSESVTIAIDIDAIDVL